VKAGGGGSGHPGGRSNATHYHTKFVGFNNNGDENKIRRGEKQQLAGSSHAFQQAVTSRAAMAGNAAWCIRLYRVLFFHSM